VIILDAHTDYSFMRGYGKPEQWLARAKDVGVTALAVTDYNSTFGHFPFYKVFKNSGIKLLYGVQVPVVGILDKDPRFSLVTLIAKDDLSDLYGLMTEAHKQSYYRPRLTWRQIEQFEGFVILNHVLQIHMKAAERLTVGAFLGVSPNMPKHMDAWTGPRVMAYAPSYPSVDDRPAFELFQAISEGQRFGEVENTALHLLRPGELKTRMTVTDEMLANAQHIADSCIATIPRGGLVSPLQMEQGDKREHLFNMVIEGAERIGFDTSLLYTNSGSDYSKRLVRELDVIAEKKFEDYFFFVEDIVSWAKKRMFVGPGRGSAGGSLLCYLLGITTVDPLKFGTLFERFIDVTRPDLPDIDVDFPDTRRDEVFAYMKEKYGEDKVARLGTLGEFGGKSAFNDTARAFGIPFDASRALGAYTEAPQGVEITAARVLGMGAYAERGPMLSDNDLKTLEKHPQLRMAAVIEGHVRQHGKHAAGVVVTNNPIHNHGTVDKDGVIQMGMYDAEDLGLVKMDALGLKTLSVIQATCDMAGIDPRTLYDLDWKDPEVYRAVFQKDRVTGVFQFEGNAVRGLMKGIKTETFDDLCALTSLARPGPLIGGAAEHWVHVRNGDEEARELHAVLDSTYGVICYQEQMMVIARELAGFDEPSVNGMRRAVGKKDPVKLKGYRDQFVKGASLYFMRQSATNDLEPAAPDVEKAEALWDELVEFGSYAFNLAHAVEYAMISYMSAWLKTYHPLEFAAACLQNADDEQGKSLLRELSEEGYQYVPFDPVRSQATWSIQDGKLYGGFDSVKGVGIATAKKLLAAREADPEKWLDNLTTSQRNRITKEFNTPWHDLTYFTTKYEVIYKDPEAWRGDGVKAGFKGPVLRIKDLPSGKQSVAFIGRIAKKTKKDANEQARVDKRGGVVYDKNTYFVNLIVADDTGEVGGTINRFKADDYKWLMDSDTEGRDFFFRATLSGGDRRWCFIDKVLELKPIIPTNPKE
jgi:DNA polymerase III alpha subunit